MTNPANHYTWNAAPALHIQHTNLLVSVLSTMVKIKNNYYYTMAKILVCRDQAKQYFIREYSSSKNLSYAPEEVRKCHMPKINC